MRWAPQPPDPLHFWIGLAPRGWPVGGQLWVDLARRGLGSATRASAEIPRGWTGELPSVVVYMPPVPGELASRRSELVGSLAGAGAPVLAQMPVGSVASLDSERVVIDPLETLLSGRLELLRDLPSGSRVAWPLIAGLTDRTELWEEGLAALGEAGVQHVQPVALELGPADKRRLVERVGEESFHSLFHGVPPSEQLFSKLAAKHGFSPFLPRPLPAEGTMRGNQSLAEKLAVAGELWLRVGRSESGGQDLYRAARWVDRERHDLTTLCREGNLGVFPWLDPTSAQVITDVVGTGTAKLVQELEAEYLGSLT